MGKEGTTEIVKSIMKRQGLGLGTTTGQTIAMTIEVKGKGTVVITTRGQDDVSLIKMMRMVEGGITGQGIGIVSLHLTDHLGLENT